MSSNKQTHEYALRMVRAGPGFRSKQGQTYAPTILAAPSGTKASHVQTLTIPAGEVGRAHKHQRHETGIYIISGEPGVWYGESLEYHEAARAGEFVYIPANLPRLPCNPGVKMACIAINARTDPNEQEKVELLPDLESKRATASSLHAVESAKEPVVFDPAGKWGVR